MKFNIAYFGPEAIFHLRRDFILALKYGLEDLGHDVCLSGLALERHRFNLIIGAYFLPPEELKKLPQAGVEFAHVNTEVVAQDMLNFRPEKTDFLGAYLPSMQAGKFVWDVILDNLAEHSRYGTKAHFLRWGWHPKLADIEHRQDKELDYYFFGLMSPRRAKLLAGLAAHGLKGLADHSCPYYLRNDRIARSRVQLNIIQADQYSHVNSFRICYLANNHCAILSEAETDPAQYLELAIVAPVDQFAEEVANLARTERWRQQGSAAYEKFRALPMTTCLEALLDDSFAPAAVHV